MKQYLFSEDAKKEFRGMLVTPPIRVWYDAIEAVFEFSDHYLTLECESALADSVNSYDEAIIAKYSYTSGVYKPRESSELVCENISISKVFVLRTFLSFTEKKAHTHNGHRTKLFLSKIKKIFIGIERMPIDEKMFLLSDEKITSEYYEVITNPNSDDAKDVDAMNSNIIDCGLMCKTNTGYLISYICNNGYHFFTFQTKSLEPSNKYPIPDNKYEHIDLSKAQTSM